MNKHHKRVLYALLSFILLVSAAVVPALTARAEAGFDHPLSNSASNSEKAYVNELKALDPSRIYSYSAYDFDLPYKDYFGDKLVNDPDAYTGMAAEVRADTRKSVEPGSEQALNLLFGELPVRTADINNEEVQLGSISGRNLIADGKYHLYKVDDVVVVKDKTLKFLFIFNDWGFQIPGIPEDLAHEPNAKVDLYISMKITGNMLFMGNNLPAYYIDRVIVAGPVKKQSTIIPLPTDPIITTEPTEATEPTETTAPNNGNQGAITPTTPTVPDNGDSGPSDIIVMVPPAEGGNDDADGVTKPTDPTTDPTEETQPGTEATEDNTTDATEDTEATLEATKETTENTENPETSVDVTGEGDSNVDKGGSKNRTAVILGIIAAVVLVGAGGAVYFLLRYDKKKIAIIVSIAAGAVLVVLLIVLMICTAKQKNNPLANTTAGTVLNAPSASGTTDATTGDSKETTEGAAQPGATDGTMDPTADTTEAIEPSTSGSGTVTVPYEGIIVTDPANPNGPTTPTTPTVTEPVLVNGKLSLTGMKIVLPQSATAVEKNAANELVTYVKKITGKTIQTVTEGTSVNAGIYIGATNFVKTNNVTHPSSEYGEGWAIKAVNDNLVLCGDATRGPLYAVYHLLEDVLGVHWWNYTEEYVPTSKTALVPRNYDDKGKPAFKYRDMHPGALNSTTNMFQVRNRLNGWETNAPAGFGGEENFGSPVYVHSFSHYVPDSMFSSHPEWFSLVNGQRKQQSQLCMTNRELIAYMKEKLLGYIEQDIATANRNGTARPRWYALVPNDWEQFCECSSCKAVINQSGMSGYLLKFVNEIAASVEKSHPEILIDTLAYHVYIEPPKDGTKPAKNVQIRFADNLMDVMHGYDHPNNAKTLGYLKEWAKITQEGQLFVWDYVVTYGVNGTTPTMYKFPEHFQTLLANGVTGYFGEQEDPINTDFWDMKMWLNAKMLEDPYQDFDALMDTFLNGYYGAGGPYVRKYLDMVGGLLEDSSIYCHFGMSSLSPRWLTVDAVLAADKYFDMAFAAVNGDETLLRRLRLARNCLDRVIVARFEAYKADAATLGLAFDLNKKEVCRDVINCLKEQIALRGNADYVAKTTVLPYFEGILAGLS